MAEEAATEALATDEETLLAAAASAAAEAVDEQDQQEQDQRRKERLELAISRGARGEAGSAEVEPDIKELVEHDSTLLERELTGNREKFLHLACKHEGNFPAVDYALGRNPKLVNQTKGDSGTTPLFTAAYFGNLKMMRLLLTKYGANPLIFSKGNCSFVHIAMFGAARAQATRRREIYVAVLTLIEELQLQPSDGSSPYPAISFLNKSNLERHVENCPHNGLGDLRSHANGDEEIKQRLRRVGIRRLFENAGDGGGFDSSHYSRDFALLDAKAVLEQVRSGDHSTTAGGNAQRVHEVYMESSGARSSITPTRWGGYIPVLGWRAVVLTTKDPQATTLQHFVESQQWPTSDSRGLEWSASPYHPKSKERGNVGYMMYTLKPKNNGSGAPAQGQQKYFDEQQKRSKVSVRVYFLYGEDGKRNNDRQ